MSYLVSLSLVLCLSEGPTSLLPHLLLHLSSSISVYLVKQCCRWPYRWFLFSTAEKLIRIISFSNKKILENSVMLLFSFFFFFLKKKGMKCETWFWKMFLSMFVNPLHKNSVKLPVHLCSFPWFVQALAYKRECLVYFKKSSRCMVLSWSQRSTVQLLETPLVIFLAFCASIFQPFHLLLWQLDGMPCHLVQSRFSCRQC